MATDASTTTDKVQVQRLSEAFEAGIEVGQRRMLEKLHRMFADLEFDVCNAQLLDMPIEELHVQQHTYEVIRLNQVQTLRDLISKSEADLLAYHLLGQRGLDDVIQALAEHGLHLKE
jgi:DNA-directed RNA polymerase alpha subunit